MLHVRGIAQLAQVVADAHAFDKAQRKLRLFAAGQQLQHLAHRHLRREAIGPGLEVRQLRFHPQQPLENARAIDHLLAIEILAQRQPAGASFEGKDGLFLNQQLAVRQLAYLPHACRRGDAQQHDQQQDKT